MRFFRDKDVSFAAKFKKSDLMSTLFLFILITHDFLSHSMFRSISVCSKSLIFKRKSVNNVQYLSLKQS